MLDRLVGQAISQVLTPIFDPDFSESSFGFRPRRCAHGALRQVQRYIGEGYRIAVDLDLEKFFDKVRHDVLVARVARKVSDKRLLTLIGRSPREPVSWSGTPSKQPRWEPCKVPLSLRCSPTSCWMISTVNSNDVATRSRVTPMIF